MNTPALLKPPHVYFCAECGAAFFKLRVDQIHCSARCNQAKHRRRQQGGIKLYDAAMKWRLKSHSKGFLSELTQLADQLAAEERLIRKARLGRIAEYKAEMKRRKAA